MRAAVIVSARHQQLQAREPGHPSQMRHAGHDASSSVEHRHGGRDRVLRQQRNGPEDNFRIRGTIVVAGQRLMSDIKYLTTDEVVERYRGEVSAGTLRNWRAQRVGPPFIKIGKSVLYPVQGLDEWDKKNLVICRASRKLCVADSEGECDSRWITEYRSQIHTPTASLKAKKYRKFKAMS